MKISTMLIALWGMLFAGAAGAAEMSPQQFAESVAETNRIEIASSELALKNGTSEQVKAFAQDMIEEHKKSDAHLQQAAKDQGITLQQSAGAGDDPVIKSLEAKSGEEFDKAYLAAQVEIHTKALGVFESYAKDGEAGPIKTFADQTFPAIRMHLVRLKSMTPDDE